MKANALLALRKQADELYTASVRSSDHDPIDASAVRRSDRELAQARSTVARVISPARR